VASLSVTPSPISSIGEHALIERLRRRLRRDPDFVVIGIGDDAAVIQNARSSLEVITTDSLVEGVHFRREWTTAEAIGHKALAVNLSDLAAMGATPRAVLLSLAMPSDLPLSDFDALLDGFVALADRTGAALIGGNLTRSPGPLIVDVTAIGAVRRRGMLRRSGARAGDELYVTGMLGAAAAGLAMLEAGTDRSTLDEDSLVCVDRYERPEPRLKCAQIVSRASAASAAIDLSDGLADAVRQLAAASSLGAVINAAALPLAPGAEARASADGQTRSALDLALSGGEDYELLFAVPSRRKSRLRAATRRCAGLPITWVGRLTTEPGTWLEQDGSRTILPSGYAHF
jgi:thiamine-monophosphate kinase